MNLQDLEDDKKLEEATKNLEAALKKNPKDKEAYLQCAEVYKEHGNFLEAPYLYEQAIKTTEDNADIHFKLAEIETELYRDWDMDEAIYHWYAARNAYQIAIKKDPNNAHYLFQFGMFYCIEVETKEDNGFVYNERFYDKAVKYFRQALKLDSDNVEIQFHLANALSEEGETKGAIQVLQELLKLDSSHSKASSKLEELSKLNQHKK